MNPILVKGSCNTALVYARAIEQGCEDQLLVYLNQPAFANTKVRIMPDMHPGKGALVGFTATCNDYAVPALIGVDIGCGISAYKLGRGKLPFDKLDSFLCKNIPAGIETRKNMDERAEKVYPYSAEMPFSDFKRDIREICEAQEQNLQRVLCGLGTLGGGNHFIEIDQDEEHNRWLLIHTGSRNFGLLIAEHHIDLAISKTPPENSIKYLEGEDAQAYYRDMKTAQRYAEVNRALIAAIIIEDFFKESMENVERIETVHNYIDFKEKIVRKGAVSAQKDQPVVIPFSMSEGAIIGLGKGNPEWNYSAPHGSGRKLTRTQAKGLSMDEYRKRMRGIWSSRISKKTLDESPMVYKRSKDILDFIEETVAITHRLTPLYNFKAED